MENCMTAPSAVVFGHQNQELCPPLERLRGTPEGADGAVVDTSVTPLDTLRHLPNRMNSEM
jgi:hypothetical protein